ncbi:MAG: hypothetical protein ACREIU_06135, partial [Planctomycetota bacterium]
LGRARSPARSSLLASLGRLARRAHDAGLRIGEIGPEGVFATEAGGLLLGCPRGLGVGALRSVAQRRGDLEGFVARLPLSMAERARALRAYDPFGHLFPHSAPVPLR